MAELWPTQWDMGRSESGEKQNVENGLFVSGVNRRAEEETVKGEIKREK
jgi:hypothetical protein